MHVSDTSQEISLTICLDLPNTLPSFQFYQCLKILSLQKLWWSSDISVYQGKEIQEKATQAPVVPGKRLCLSCMLACQGSAPRQNEGLLSLWCPEVQGERLSAQAHGSVLSLSPCPCSWRGMGLHKRPVTSAAAPGAGPAGDGSLPVPSLCGEGPTAAWQIGWDFTPKLPAKRPHSQVSIFSESAEVMALTRRSRRLMTYLMQGDRGAWALWNLKDRHRHLPPGLIFILIFPKQSLSLNIK